MGQAIAALLLDQNEQAGIVNTEIGTGKKTMVAIALAAVMHRAGIGGRWLSLPHLVYKWRRVILEKIPNASVGLYGFEELKITMSHNRPKANGTTSYRPRQPI